MKDCICETDKHESIRKKLSKSKDYLESKERK